VSASFSSALHAAHEAASGQHYPQSALYIVATPIGNLADISLRALHVLSLVDTVACEDTRHTQQLLRAYGIEKSPAQLLAVHQHNESEAAQAVLQRLQAGQRVAYVSDAGTPGISDPGARLVYAVTQQGLRCIPLPGASSITALFSIAGTTAPQANTGPFFFAGFLPSKAQERAHKVQSLSAIEDAIILLEAPHRIADTAQALSTLAQRKITVGRELTKQFEEIATLCAQDLPAWFAADKNRLRGEFALLLHPVAPTQDTAIDTRVLTLLMPHLPLKTAVQIAAQITGISRNVLYEAALALKGAGESS
jgi:16S rRNA (cytidine1402-2'-O)-methyltransferase